MKTNILKRFLICGAMLLGGFAISNAQMPVGPIGGPGPVINAPGSPAGLGSNDNVPPNPGGPDGQNALPPLSQGGPGLQIPQNPSPGPFAPQPAGPPPGPSPLAPLIVNGPNPNWQNAGNATVIACGYDAQGVWRTIPLHINYVYNGAQYNITVVSAWNPWTDCWNYDIDVPAFSTDYFLNGQTFNYYTNLSTGTFYFNL